jgi:di/tricarboxylate transporter
VFLAGMQIIYAWAAILHGDRGSLGVEALGLLGFLGLALAGYARWPRLIGIGIIAHGLAWDSWHHGHSGYIPDWYSLGCLVTDLGVGLFALLPPVGMLDESDMRHVNYMPVFFVAAAISMGNVLEATKGLEVLTSSVFTHIEPFLGNIFSTTVIMYWAGFIYHFFLASEISMLGTSMPLVMEFAKSHGMNPLMLGLLWTFSAGGKLFAYQSGVLVLGYSYGYFEARDLLRIGAWLTVVEFLILLLLVPFYWPLIGIY